MLHILDKEFFMVAPDFFFSEELLFFVHIRRLEKSFQKMVCSATV
jgi:hypothetical protein